MEKDLGKKLEVAKKLERAAELRMSAVRETEKAKGLQRVAQKPEAADNKDSMLARAARFEADGNHKLAQAVRLEAEVELMLDVGKRR